MTNKHKLSLKRRRLRPTDPEFEAPDGGWGWVIVFGAGASNFCLYPVLQQYGLLYKDKFDSLGFTTSQTTTIFNLNLTLTYFIGLANGPLFRKFTFRKVSIFGAIICTIAFLTSSQANTFIAYVFSISVLYGIGLGISTSANALALNTYFKKRRTIATGFSWTATALGAIIFPHIITFLLDYYGVEGTLLIFAGIALNAVLFATLLQPVHWHTKYKDAIEWKPETEALEDLRISSENVPDCMEPSDSMLPQANDTLNRSKLSLDKNIEEVSTEMVDIHRTQKRESCETPPDTCWQKLVTFFDLDLLKDGVYVNIAIGLTIATFAEMNFTGLTPFILRDFGFSKHQTASFMSLLGGVDIVVRFLVPFVTSKLKFSNRTFFLCGVCMMSFGRILLAHTQEYHISLAIAVLIGIGKGLRTIFMALVIPGYVPLVRLPGAAGLQLFFNGIFSVSMAPLIGWIHDFTGNYVVTLYCLNVFTWTTTISWTLEKYLTRRTQ